MDVSLKEDKVNLDVTKKDGSTATLTPSEDSVKTEEEKKDESEVKQEEKKEETAKADSSNKSNTSESKKENTTATTNTSSNKNNTNSSSKPSNSSNNNSSSSKPSNNSGSNSSSSKPAEHTHNWVAVTETRTVVDQAAYDEQVPITEMRAHEICNQCGADITADPNAHNNQHLLNYESGGWHTEWREEVTGYQTVHHDAVTHTETVTTGYKCSSCGKTKAN